MKYTERVERLVKDLGVDYSVAMDIDYLRLLEKRVIKAAKAHPELRHVPVFHPELETKLELWGV